MSVVVEAHACRRELAPRKEHTHENASEVNSIGGGSAPLGTEIVKLARNWAQSNHIESSAKSLPGQELGGQRGQRQDVSGRDMCAQRRQH